MERFHGVHGRANVEATTRALEESNCEILKHPDPSVAPFEYVIRTPEGEVLDLVCYAFTANKYRQRGRPTDEHRLQVKYGSDFKRPYELFVDGSRRRITLMFGVHEEEGIFIAVDPTLHNPTWFSSSIEFKQENVNDVKRLGWVGWERDRKRGRRHVMPSMSFTTESLLGFKPRNFLRYVRLEQMASAMETGPRLLLIDKMGLKTPDSRHPLELVLGLSASEVLDVINGNFRLLVAVRGGVAEHHLLAHLNRLRELSDVRHVDADGQPDFEVRYRSKWFRIECKNVLRKVPKDGIGRVDFQKTRASKKDPCSRYYRRDQFEVLAACMQPIRERWEFEFAATNRLPEHQRCEGRISDKLLVSGSSWKPGLVQVLDELMG